MEPAPPSPKAGASGFEEDKAGAAMSNVCDRATPPPASLRGKTVWVIDTHSLVYQVFHALPEMMSPAGQPVQAVFGFARDVLGLLATKKPDYLFAAIDMPGKTFRHAMYDQYKANRPDMPDELKPQMPAIRRVLAAMRVPVLGLASFEADDVLATVARLVDGLGGECYLVTSDKDCRQLITDRVKLYNVRKNETMDRDALVEAWGIEPSQVVDFQALVGDSTDNVPGVPLIGPKIAGELLQKYKTLENVLDHAGELSGKKRKENLLAGRDVALLSRRLVRLDDNVPAPIDWEGGQVGGVDRPALLALFREFGFRSLVERFSSEAPEAAREGDSPVFAEQKLGQSPGMGDVRYRLVDSPEALDEFVTQLAKQKCVSIDTETTALWPRWAELVGYSFAWRDDEAWYVPVRAPKGDPCLDPKKTADALRPLLEDPALKKIGQNLKYDMIVLRGAGINLAGLAFDTMVASYLLDAGERNHNLDELAERYLNHTTIKISQLIGKGKDQKRMDEVPVSLVCDYAGEDALVAWRLWPILEKRLAESGLERLFVELELPLVETLAEMESNGIRVSRERLAELSRHYGERMDELEREIYKLANGPFNIASPKQLQQVLFVEQGLPVLKKTKTGPSTDAEVLEELAPLHPLPAKIIEYRQYAKLKSTYVDALPEMIHPVTGRVHASFNQVVTATGRLSSSDPNLQNIPVRSEEGREIRSAFVPGESGWSLLAADYSQIELRMLAHFSGDERLCEAFERDEDIHARVASQVHGVALDQVTSAMRREAKAVNFGVIYGQSPFGLSKQLGISQEAAAKFIHAYFEGYPQIEEFLDGILADCARFGYVSTILGRRRAIRGVRADVGGQRNQAERTAINTVIQGSAADLIKQAMIAIHARLARERFPARLLLQIHDELIFEAPTEELAPLRVLVADEMTGAWKLKVPLKVDVKAGPNWADAEPVE
ncbi:MAG TPA: DNA polymerase I [Thermoguttaceae bacterium]|nr:DNA polymerase I [Thermoguttaceae bacterium]